MSQLSSTHSQREQKALKEREVLVAQILDTSRECREWNKKTYKSARKELEPQRERASSILQLLYNEQSNKLGEIYTFTKDGASSALHFNMSEEYVHGHYATSSALAELLRHDSGLWHRHPSHSKSTKQLILRCLGDKHVPQTLQDPHSDKPYPYGCAGLMRSLITQLLYKFSASFDTTLTGLFLNGENPLLAHISEVYRRGNLRDLCLVFDWVVKTIGKGQKTDIIFIVEDLSALFRFELETGELQHTLECLIGMPKMPKSTTEDPRIRFKLFLISTKDLSKISTKIQHLPTITLTLRKGGLALEDYPRKPKAYVEDSLDSEEVEKLKKKFRHPNFGSWMDGGSFWL